IIDAAFLRCIAIEIRCLRNERDLISFVANLRRSPKSEMNLSAFLLYTPSVSMATRTKIKRFSKNLYLSSLLCSACLAAAPGFAEVWSMYDGHNVSTHVKSHTNDFPNPHGLRVRPSGFFPSSREQPGGSRILGTP